MKFFFVALIVLLSGNHVAFGKYSEPAIHEPIKMKLNFGLLCEYDSAGNPFPQGCLPHEYSPHAEENSTSVELIPTKKGGKESTWHYGGYIDGRWVDIRIDTDLFQGAVTFQMYFRDFEAKQKTEQFLFFHQAPHGQKIYFEGPELVVDGKMKRYMLIVEIL